MRRNVPLGGIAQTAWGKSPLPLQVKGLAALNFSSMSERMLTVRTDPDDEKGAGAGSLDVVHRAGEGTTMTGSGTGGVSKGPTAGPPSEGGCCPYSAG